MWAKIVAFFMAILAFFGIKINKPIEVRNAEKLSSFNVISECRYLQGACTDGEYVYQAFSHQVESENEGNYIFQIDAETFDVVRKISLTAGHMNDMTYNPKTNKIISVNSGGTNSKADRITVIDPDTLEIIDTVNVGNYIFAMDYDPVNDVYYAGKYGASLLILDSGFKVIGEYPIDCGDYTKQSICYADGKLYFLLYGTKVSKPNVIRVFSTTGEFLYDHEIGIDKGEPEGLFRLDGTFYVTFAENDYTKGGIYRLAPFEK